MGYSHHIQSPMGGSPIDPKFPPNSDEYQHHNGYGGHNGMPAMQANDYGVHHQSNGLHHHNANNFNYGQSPFYHHGYNSNMPHNMPNNGYTPTNNTYYGSYYSTPNGGSHHQNMDLPLQCSSVEPTNTVLGLQELGKWLRFLCNNRALWHTAKLGRGQVSKYTKRINKPSDSFTQTSTSFTHIFP